MSLPALYPFGHSAFPAMSSFAFTSCSLLCLRYLKEGSGRLDLEFALCHLLDSEAHCSDVLHKQESVQTKTFRNDIIFDPSVSEV